MNTIMTPKGSLFIFGGVDEENKISNKVFQYRNKELIEKQKMPIAKKQSGYCYHNNCIYVFGGKLQNDEKTNICEKYIIKENRWVPLP